MNILAIGDVVGSKGCEFLRSHLPSLKKMKNIDIVIVNGENSADGNGITPLSAQHIMQSGADVITTGNHAFRRKEIYDFMDENDYIVRPANYPEGASPGRGYTVIDLCRVKVGVINLMGTAFMEALDCPFRTLDHIVDELEKQNVKIRVLDFHAEATGEKRAMGFYAQKKITAMFGTHTHVQTSDACLIGDMGYVTDVGMTGAVNSVLGVKPELIIEKLKNKMPVRFAYEQDGPSKLDGVLYTIDDKTYKTTGVELLEIM